MHAATESSCEPAALAAAVRALAHDAYLALKGTHPDASLAELARRAIGFRGCLGDHSTVPLGLWLENLARALEHAGNEGLRRDISHAGRTSHGFPPPAGRRIRPAIARV